jgi:flagellar biosynthesis/type III secretory pathway protein FliH
MDLLEIIVFNIKNEIEKYGEEQFDAGKEEALTEVTEEYERGRTDGHEEGYQQGREDTEPKERELLTFAIEKFKEAAERAVSFEQILLELESDLCKHMPAHGLRSKQVKAKF